MRRPTRKPSSTLRWTALAGGIAVLVACGSSSGSGTIGAGDAKGGVRPSGTIVADSGFAVDKNGFSFENYANSQGISNLSPASMRTLFGDQVCARVADGNCTLTPSAAKWMATQNDGMNGGHCFGMAGLSWAVFKGSVPASKYGADTASQMKLPDNVPLQSDLAAVFVTQLTDPTTSKKIELSPNEAVAKLKEGWAAGTGFVLALYKLVGAEQSAGHGVTPVSVEDRGEGKMGIILYDNNFPGVPQVMVVDTATNTWTYSTASDPRNDPESYTGGANNKLVLYPVDPMVAAQSCPFCTGGQTNTAQGVGSTPTSVGSGSAFNYVYLNQEGGANGVHISVTDLAGNPIAGTQELAPLSFDNGVVPPVVAVPKQAAFAIKVDGSKMTKGANAAVAIIGPGYDFGIDKIDMNPGEVDTIRFDPATNKLAYQTNAGAAPDIVLGLDGKDVSYAFLFGGLALSENGGTIEVALNPAKQTVTASSGNTGESKIDFQVERIDQASEEQFDSEPIPLAGNEALIIEYGKWKGNGTPMPVGIDKNNDGKIDETLVVADKS
ncbi:MAG: hypothetical protein WCI74_02350 [Actinomycetes bacterium]